MKNVLKERGIFVAVGLIFLVVMLFLISYFLKWPEFLFPKASTSYNLTGSWSMSINITSPASHSISVTANIVQDSSGILAVTGTSADVGTISFTGTVSGNQVSCNRTDVSMTVMGMNVAAWYTMTGTVDGTGNQMTGSISGQVTSPALFSGQLVGNFTAQRQGGAPTLVPTATPTRTPTPTPTLAPTQAPTSSPTLVPTRTPTAAPTIAGSSTTPTPTGTSSGSQTPTPTSTSTSAAATTTTTPTAAGLKNATQTTPLPIPVTGTDWPTLLGAGLGVVVIVGSIILAI